eukprot:Protomagalhaensia_sp_Gyna_25__1648@NODE_1855_length_1469_cov_32_888112_g1524_i0_p1_GENE_NODE_1855_length_1469_cov_32_888112_g1524_i0NODE_1855_length_1469_cov_32_888112_g1524_i0_p1_ORF_typecomplete_len385_score20_84PHO4/PF01384_20/1_4e03PHO4/PF01384_20/0_081_NODE_1855_length_1469_cov_32_888112_g1524_i02151369
MGDVGVYAPLDDTAAMPYWIFQAGTFGRSVLIIFVVVTADLLVKGAPLFSVLAPNTTGITNKGVRVLNVLIPFSSHHNVRRVVSYYAWVLRTAMVLITCAAFDTLVLKNTRFDMRRPSEWNQILYSCYTGWNCYAWQPPDTNENNPAQEKMDNYPAFLPFYFVWDLASICRVMTGGGLVLDENIKSRSSRNSAVLCFKTASFGFTECLTIAAIMLATVMLVFFFFDVIVSVMVRYRRSVWNVRLLVDVLIALTLAIWILLLLFEGATAISTWVSRLTFLALPVIMYCGRAVGSILRQELQKKQTARGRELLESRIGKELDKLVGAPEEDEELFNEQEDTVRKQRFFPIRFRGRRLALWSKLKHASDEKDSTAATHVEQSDETRL